MVTRARRLLGARVLASLAGASKRASHAADSGSAPPPARLGWIARGLLAAAIAVPLLLLALAAGQNYRLVQKEAVERVATTAGEMREQALRAFQTYALVLDWVGDRAQGLGWERNAGDRKFHRFLSDLDSLPQIDKVRVVDAAGQVRACGCLLPASPVNVADRDYFITQKAARIDLYVGRDHVGRLTRGSEFDISRRLPAADGGFGGIVTISVRPSYFQQFYGALGNRQGFAALLVRDDGAVLVRLPQRPGRAVLPRGSPLRRAVESRRASGVFEAASAADGVRRLFAFQRVPGYPVAVAFGVPTAGVFAAWRANLISYSLFAAPASVGLFLLTLLALRQLQRGELLRWRWRVTAQRLRREMRKRELAEEELRQAHKMEALGQLTGGVAHDFNNLLAILQISLEMLQGRQADDGLEAKVALALETVARGEKLVGQLLAFARRQSLRVESVDVNAHLRGMGELLARAVGDKVAIETDLAPDLAPVWADVNQLELAVLNLAINARDAMPQGGRLRIRTRNEARRLALPAELAPAADGFVALEISDTGHGMAPEVLARAFEPFFTTKEKGRGTGLGLSAVYGFARQSGGTALIESAPGQGTTVALVLPKNRPGTSGQGLPADAAA